MENTSSDLNVFDIDLSKPGDAGFTPDADLEEILLDELYERLEKPGDFYCQLGEYTGIGSSCGLLRIDGKVFLIDAGTEFKSIRVNNKKVNIQIGPSGDYLPDLHIDAILMTHGHLDHDGSLPAWTFDHPEAWIFVTEKALAGIKVMLNDSLKIAVNNAKLALTQGLKPSIPIFDIDDLNNLLAREADQNKFMVVKDKSWNEIPDLPDWKIGVHPSGHNAGAVMYFIASPSGKRITITGDVCSHDQENNSGVMLPDENFLGDFLNKPVKLITEATYGNRPMEKSRAQLWSEIISLVKKVRSQNGTTLISTFAMNRAGNIVTGLVENLFDFLIESDLKILVDGMARDMVKIEIPSHKLEDWIEKEIVILVSKEPALAWEQRRNALNGGYIIVAPSATMEHGYSVFYGMHVLEGTENAVIFPGYVFENSPAEEILGNKTIDVQKGRTVKLTRLELGREIEEIVNVRCTVLHVPLTAHDFQGGLVERAIKMQPEIIIVHHTTDEGFEGYKNALATKFGDYGPRIERGRHLRIIELN